MVDPHIQVYDQNVPSRETLPVEHSTFWISETIQFSTVHVVKKKTLREQRKKTRVVCRAPSVRSEQQIFLF